jgi:uncharacterized protein GlcG (DUF336 family)
MGNTSSISPARAKECVRATPLMCVMGRFDIHAFISHINAPMAHHLTHCHSPHVSLRQNGSYLYAFDGSIVEAYGVTGDQGQHDAHAQGGDAIEEDDQAGRFDEV